MDSKTDQVRQTGITSEVVKKRPCLRRYRIEIPDHGACDYKGGLCVASLHCIFLIRASSRSETETDSSSIHWVLLCQRPENSCWVWQTSRPGCHCASFPLFANSIGVLHEEHMIVDFCYWYIHCPKRSNLANAIHLLMLNVSHGFNSLLSFNVIW